MRPKRKWYLAILDWLITAFLFCWYSVADRVRLRLARRYYEYQYYPENAPEHFGATPVVSIIMPTIGRDATKAIDSVLAQTYKNWELIIVGDGVWPCEYTHYEYGKIRGHKIDKVRHYPVHCFYQWLAGPCRAINYGLSRVRGDWIARIDDDDVWHPRHLKWALETATKYNEEFVSFPIDLNGQWPEPYTFNARQVGAVQSWLYRSYLKCFRTNLHCWRKKWNAVNDIDLSERMAWAGVKMCYFISPEPHATIKPRPGLTEVGIKGWLQEGEQNARGQEFSGGNTGQGRQ